MARNNTTARLFEVVIWMQERETPWCIKELAEDFGVSYQTARAWKDAAEYVGLIRITRIAAQTTMWRKVEHRSPRKSHIREVPNS